MSTDIDKRIATTKSRLESLKKEKRAAARAERELRRAEETKQTAEFRTDLERQYGLSDCVVADALWDIAWGEGHSSGYNEVEQHYREFAERLVMPLLKDTP